MVTFLGFGKLASLDGVLDLLLLESKLALHLPHVCSVPLAHSPQLWDATATPHPTRTHPIELCVGRLRVQSLEKTAH